MTVVLKGGRVIDRNGDGGIDGDRPIQRCRTILGSCVRELTQRS